MKWRPVYLHAIYIYIYYTHTMLLHFICGRSNRTIVVFFYRCSTTTCDIFSLSLFLTQFFFIFLISFPEMQIIIERLDWKTLLNVFKFSTENVFIVLLFVLFFILFKTEVKENLWIAHDYWWRTPSSDSMSLVCLVIATLYKRGVLSFTQLVDCRWSFATAVLDSLSLCFRSREWIPFIP